MNETDRNQAIQDVHEIKQVMEESRKRSNRGKYWLSPTIAVLAVIAVGFFPFLAPVVGIGLLAGGIVAWRRASDSMMKSIAVGMIAIGIILILVSLYVISALGVFSTTTTTVTTTPIR